MGCSAAVRTARAGRDLIETQRCCLLFARTGSRRRSAPSGLNKFMNDEIRGAEKNALRCIEALTPCCNDSLRGSSARATRTARAPNGDATQKLSHELAVADYLQRVARPGRSGAHVGLEVTRRACRRCNFAAAPPRPMPCSPLPASKPPSPCLHITAHRCSELSGPVCIFTRPDVLKTVHLLHILACLRSLLASGRCCDTSPRLCLLDSSHCATACAGVKAPR